MNAKALLSESAIESVVARSSAPTESESWAKVPNLSTRTESVMNAHQVADAVDGCFDNA